MQQLLHTVALGWSDWALMIAAGAPLFLVNEVYKWIRWGHRSNGE